MAAPARSRLKRLAVSCPNCGSPPGVKVSELEVKLKRKLPPHWLVMTLQCIPCSSRRGMVVIYEVTAKAYHGAA